MTDPLDRIAAALERLAPQPPDPADPLAHPAYLWRGTAIEVARAFTPLPIDALIGVDRQRAALIANCERLAAGLPAQDVMLWGARGSGKSALAVSSVAAVQAAGGDLALVQAAADRLETLPRLFAALAPVPRAFAVYLDDLGIDDQAEARALRSMLEGGAEARPRNVRMIVTANRRHLVPRSLDDADAVNPRDAADDILALADRFWLSLGFHAIDQAHYLAIVQSYADRHGLAFDAADAIGWALRRGARSGRVAWQYVIDLAGRSDRRIEPPVQS